MHTLCLCPTANQVLSAAPFHLKSTFQQHTVFKWWMLDRALTMPQDLFETLLVVLSALWKNRNNMLWQNKSKTHTDIVLGALLWLQEFHVVRKPVSAPTVKKKLKWKPAEDGYYKLNVDGSYLPQKTNGGVGGVVQNSQGKFMAAFAKPMLFMASVKQVELSAIKEGQLLVKSMQLNNVLVETDCSEAVSAIRAIQHETMEEAGLIDDIKEFIEDNDRVQKERIRLIDEAE
ncbi:hypothetical protein ACLB2K_059091 [Fragaria x ananassa]